MMASARHRRHFCKPDGDGGVVTLPAWYLSTWLVTLFSFGSIDAHRGSQRVRQFVPRSKNPTLQGPVANAQNLARVGGGQPFYGAKLKWSAKGWWKFADLLRNQFISLTRGVRFLRIRRGVNNPISQSFWLAVHHLVQRGFYMASSAATNHQS